MTHDELQEDLAVHLRGNTDRMVWTNTQLGPVGSPRPDLFTVDKSFARFRADAYEIKVSVSDLRSDLTKGKWQSYRKFGHAVWFAFPRGMAPLDLIPKECGVILRGETWRAARKPIAQVLDTLPRDAWLKLLIEGPQSGRPPRERNSSSWHAQELIRKKWGSEIAELFSARQMAAYKYEAATKELAESADKIRQDVEARMRYARESAEREKVALDGGMKRLANVLGLTAEESTPEGLAAALHGLANRLGRPRLTETMALLKQLSEVAEVAHG